jgi:hypothetical protein
MKQQQEETTAPIKGPENIDGCLVVLQKIISLNYSKFSYIRLERQLPLPSQQRYLQFFYTTQLNHVLAPIRAKLSITQLKVLQSKG